MPLTPRAGLAALALAAAGAVGWALSTGGPTAAPTGPSASFAPDRSALTRPAVLGFIGDAYTAGTNMGGIGVSNFTAITAGHLGYGYEKSAVGGTGYVAGPQHAKAPFGDPSRLVPFRDPQPDVLIFFNGFDDFGKSLTAIKSAAVNAYGAARAALPHARVVVIGYIPLKTVTHYDVKANAALSAAAKHADVTFVDPDSYDWFLGDNFVKYIGVDRTHPTDEGHAYLATKVEGVLHDLGLDHLPSHPA